MQPGVVVAQSFLDLNGDNLEKPVSEIGDEKKVPKKESDAIFGDHALYDPGCTQENPASIYVLGDSLTVGMRDDGALKEKLEEKGWGTVDIQATSGFNIEESLPKVEADKAAVDKATTVVIGLGTNRDTQFSDKVTELINKIREAGNTPNIYWINTYTGPGAFIDGGSEENDRINSALETKAEELGFSIIDWNEEVQDKPEEYPFLDDQVHHTPEGSVARAQYIANSVGNAPRANATASATTEASGPATSATGSPDIEKITPAPFTGNPISPTGVVLHWTGGNPNQTVDSFISGISGRGLSVQLYIDGAGRVYQLVDNLATHTSHAGNANSKTIGIEIGAGSDGTVGTAESEINANQVQKNAVARTVAFLVQSYSMQTDPDVAGLKGILSHHQVSDQKSDVGDTYQQEIIEMVKNGGFDQAEGSECEEDPESLGSGGTPEQNKELGRAMAEEKGWTGAEWACLEELWTRESSWNQDANNPSSSAYGIPQALVELHKENIDANYPGYYASQTGSGAGADFGGGKADVQIRWGLDYIATKGVFSTPCGALEYHNANNSY